MLELIEKIKTYDVFYIPKNESLKGAFYDVFSRFSTRGKNLILEGFLPLDMRFAPKTTQASLKRLHKIANSNFDEKKYSSLGRVCSFIIPDEKNKCFGVGTVVKEHINPEEPSEEYHHYRGKGDIFYTCLFVKADIKINFSPAL